MEDLCLLAVEDLHVIRGVRLDGLSHEVRRTLISRQEHLCEKRVVKTFRLRMAEHPELVVYKDHRVAKDFHRGVQNTLDSLVGKRRLV